MSFCALSVSHRGSQAICFAMRWSIGVLEYWSMGKQFLWDLQPKNQGKQPHYQFWETGLSAVPDQYSITPVRQ
jgi:hypothetical protein